MAISSKTGARIRARRTDIAVKQAELAKKVGISPSYLNLIEHDRRNIGGKLLVNVAAALGVDTSVLVQGVDVAKSHKLRDIAADAQTEVEEERLDEFVSRFPGWADLITKQAQQVKDLEQIIGGLNDRLTHDPFLSEKMHEVLAAVSAIRSTASILVATPEINADWRARFHSNIDEESRRLAGTSAAMAVHFDKLTQSDALATTPLDVVLSFLERRRYHFPALETQREETQAQIEAALDDQAIQTDPRAHDMVQHILTRYLAEAQSLPLEPFSAAAERVGYDPAALARGTGAGLETIFRRLASLPLSPDRPEIGLVACDTSGAIVFRKAPSGFEFPRFGLACPLWPVFAALRAPVTALSHSVEGPNGTRYQSYAYAAPDGAFDFDTPAVHVAWMLLIEDKSSTDKALPLGSSCRVCDRHACAARREPSILTLPKE